MEVEACIIAIRKLFLPEFITPRREIVFRQSHVVSGQIRQRVSPTTNATQKPTHATQKSRVLPASDKQKGILS